MFKKILCTVLSALMLLSVAACGKTDETPVTYAGTLEELVDAIYVKHPLEAKMGPAMQIDLTNPDNVSYYLGLTDTTGVKEAVFSEPMMSSIAYSLCLVRVTEDADVETIKKNIKEGVNPVKWLCVEADNVVVESAGDIIVLAMTSTELGATLSQDLAAACVSIVSGDEAAK